MILSVLLLALSSCLAQGGPFVPEIDNDINPGMTPVMPGKKVFRHKEWVSIAEMTRTTIVEKVGTRIEMECEAMGAPIPMVQWYKRNKQITNHENIEINMIKSPGLGIVGSRLLIHYLLPKHQDIYRCVGEGGAEMATGVFKVYVNNTDGPNLNFTHLFTSQILNAHHLPRITLWASSMFETIGSDIVIPCKSTGSPKPVVSWIGPAGLAIINDERFTIMHQGDLLMKNIQWSDMGTYICVATNSLGQDTAETFLYPTKATTPGEQ